MRAAIIAFSMYSRIPMPMFEWKEEDMKYAMCFFPAIGAVIGAVFFGMYLLLDRILTGKDPGSGDPPRSAAFYHGRDPHGRIYGHLRCKSVIWRPGEEAGNLKGHAHRSVCGDLRRTVSDPLRGGVHGT